MLVIGGRDVFLYQLRIFIENIAITSLMGDRLTANSNRVAVERVKVMKQLESPLVCQTSRGTTHHRTGSSSYSTAYPEVEWKRGKNTMSSDWEKNFGLTFHAKRPKADKRQHPKTSELRGGHESRRLYIEEVKKSPVVSAA